MLVRGDPYSHAVTRAVIVFFLDDLAPGSCLGSRRRIVILSGSLNAPVKDIVVLVAFADKKVPEEFAQVRVIRLVVEAEGTSVVQEDSELVGESATEKISGSSHFLLHDAVVLLLLGGSLEALPRKRPAEEVHQHICQRLKVIAAGLLNTQMSVDGSVAGGAGQVLVLSVRDVQVGLRVAKLFCKAEIDDVDLVATLSNSHQEVVGLDIAMDEVTGMDVFDPGDLHMYVSANDAL
jgi:hypothetical protein